MIKKFLIGAWYSIVSLSILGMFGVGAITHGSQGPQFMSDFANPLLKAGGRGNNERAYNFDISQEKTLLENLQQLFYPDTGSGGGGAIRGLIQNIAVGILVLLLIWAGAKLVLYADDPEEVKKSLRNILYILIGALVLFFVIWFLGDALNLSNVTGITGEGEEGLLKRVEDNVLLTVLGLLKGIAFFAAIIFITYYGYQMVSAFDSEEKLKNAKTGILNVFIALVFIKVIDYIYFIASQGTFKNKAIDLVVSVSKVLGYIAGILLVIVLIYSGYMMVTANGNEEQVSKARNLIKGAFVTVVILMLFMLIIYQIFNDVIA